MKFDNASKVQEVVWRMRDSELARSVNRAILNRHYNGDPPYDEATAEENGIEVNRNFLKGVQVLADARRQWNQAFMGTANYFTVTVDAGPPEKRAGWGLTITAEINKILKESRAMLEHVRATGAGVMLHGIAPATWKDNDCPYPEALPIEAVLVPCETEIDFENMSYFAIFREWTPARLTDQTTGSKVDPGWNLKRVREVLKRTMESEVKDLGNFAELSAEKLAEVIKQDGAGYWESDAVPTVDVWDFYFREKEDGEGWYRRIILDWELGQSGVIGDKQQDFIYTSGDRPYAESLSQILHCQFGDCSARSPFKYHSVRSLGWLLWGVCDLMNRLECRFTEAVFENLMWFFRTSSQNEFDRLRKANFHHLGVIPNGIAFVPAGERFVPEVGLVESARTNLRGQVSETAASYTSDFNKGDTSRELTATETMARVNSMNALVSGMMTLAYNYEEFKDREIARRFSKGEHPAAKKFRKRCLAKGVPKEALDSEVWDVKRERSIGAGNQTVLMAAIGFLQEIRKNLGPQAQRKIDHISIAGATNQPDLADELAPLDEMEIASGSVHDAELATERLLAGFQFSIRPDMVAEDYVTTWLKDLVVTVQRAMQTGEADMTLIAGMQNMAQHIGQFIEMMGQNDGDKPKIKSYADGLGQIMNLVKSLEQQVMEKAQAGNGAQGPDPETIAKVQGQALQDQAKAANTRESHAQKTAQRQVQFEKEQERADRQLEANVQRDAMQTKAEIELDAIRESNKPKPKAQQ